MIALDIGLLEFMSEFNDGLLVVPASVTIFPLLVITKTLGSLSFGHFSFAFLLQQGFIPATRVCVVTM